MKKLLVGAVILVMVVVMLFTLTACDKYKFDAVGTKEYANEDAVGNGTLAVKQGNYLYFVNNVADDADLTKEKNEWKMIMETSIKRNQKWLYVYHLN